MKVTTRFYPKHNLVVARRKGEEEGYAIYGDDRLDNHFHVARKFALDRDKGRWNGLYHHKKTKKGYRFNFALEWRKSGVDSQLKEWYAERL